ncbi:cytochrome C oxidase subunit IV family protein [Chloroflexia bacterium SDU3-3]|nr:cytochrome C oxidase subunit IV family protein [Chloroflexia bacterium SDU3-3]
MAHTDATPAHAAHGEEAHEDHTGLYWLVAAILAIVTIVEVFWPFIGLGHTAVIGGLIALMVLKGTMVVMWFMHMKGDRNIFKFVFLAPFTLAVLFVLAFLALFSGTHPGIAG